MAVVDQLRHEAVQESEQQRVDVASVHIGIGHEDDLVVAELRDVEVVAVALRKSAAKGVDHGLDLGVRKDLVHGSLLHVQDLAADGKDGLVHAVPGRLRRAAGRISLDDEDLALRGILGLAVRKLSVGVEGKLRLREHVGPGLLLGAADLRGFLGAADDGLDGFDVAVKEMGQLVAADHEHRFRCVRAGELGLGLALEDGVRMLDRHHRRHAVAGIRAGKIRVLVLQDSEVAGVGVHQLRETGLEAGQVRAALRRVNIVAEAENILLEGVHELQRALQLDPLVRALEIDRVVDRGLAFVDLPHVGDDALGLVEGLLLLLALPLVLVINGQAGVQVSGLVEAGPEPLLLEPRLLEDLRIRLEVGLRAGSFGAADDGQQPVFQLRRGDAAGVGVLIDLPAAGDADGQVLGQGVDHGRSDAVQSAAGLVGVVVELSARVQCRHDHTLGGHAHLVHLHRNSAPVVPHGAGAVLLQRDPDRVTEPGQMLVHRVVHDLVDQVVQSFGPDASYVHAGAFPHCLQTAEDGDAVRIILCLCHANLQDVALPHNLCYYTKPPANLARGREHLFGGQFSRPRYTDRTRLTSVLSVPVEASQAAVH